MTPEELKRLRELCERATPDPEESWVLHPGNDDNEFYRAAREALPKLIEEVERKSLTFYAKGNGGRTHAEIALAEDDPNRCKHGVHGTDCFECYPKKEVTMEYLIGLLIGLLAGFPIVHQMVSKLEEKEAGNDT